MILLALPNATASDAKPGSGHASPAGGAPADAAAFAALMLASGPTAAPAPAPLLRLEKGEVAELEGAVDPAADDGDGDGAPFDTAEQSGTLDPVGIAMLGDPATITAHPVTPSAPSPPEGEAEGAAPPAVPRSTSAAADVADPSETRAAPAVAPLAALPAEPVRPHSAPVARDVRTIPESTRTEAAGRSAAPAASPALAAATTQAPIATPPPIDAAADPRPSAASPAVASNPPMDPTVAPSPPMPSAAAPAAAASAAAPDAAPPQPDQAALLAEPSFEIRATRGEVAPRGVDTTSVPMRDLPQAVAARAQAAAAAGLPPGGEARTEITLAPAELGRITLVVRAAEDGTLVVHLSAERPETLELARRHADAFERAAGEAAGRMRLELGADGMPRGRSGGAWGGHAENGPAQARAGDDATVHAARPPTDAPHGRLDLRL